MEFLDSSDGGRFLRLADGEGDTHISCLHLEMGAKIESSSITRAAALLIVHGGATIESETDAILLVVECQDVIAHALH